MRILPLDGALSLTNDGELEIFFLGVGTFFSPRLGHTNLLIVKGEDHLLVDFGGTGPAALRQVARVEPSAIRAFLPTHSHWDHVGSLEFLAIVNRLVTVGRMNGPKLKVVIGEEYQRQLWESTLRGGLGFNEDGMDGRAELFEEYFDPIRPERIAEDPPRWRAGVGSIALELFPTRHVRGTTSPEGQGFLSYGLFIDDRIFYSCDTQFDLPLIESYADRAEWWFHDASPQQTQLHASVDELRTLPSTIRERMFLVHYPDDALDTPLPDFAGWTEPGVRYVF